MSVGVLPCDFIVFVLVVFESPLCHSALRCVIRHSVASFDSLVKSTESIHKSYKTQIDQRWSGHVWDPLPSGVVDACVLYVLETAVLWQYFLT